MKSIKTSIASFGLLAYLTASPVIANDVVDTSLLAPACTSWAKDMDAPEQKKAQFCTCLVIAVIASVPNQAEVRTLVADFSIGSLREFVKRPQGAQNINLCFS